MLEAEAMLEVADDMVDAKEMADNAGKEALSVALIGPDEDRRRAVAAVLASRPDLKVRTLSSFPSDFDSFLQSLTHHDVIMVDADSDPEYAINMVERVNARGLACMMAYSAQTDVKLAIRFMRAGAREFLTLPLDPAELNAALIRFSTASQAPQQVAKTAGKLFVFLGAKGGCGVTTLASNFALVLAQESESSTLLIDLGLPLGDAAINLGINPQYSVAYALNDAARLDANFLSSLVTKHESGLTVLAAPTEFPASQPPREPIDKLMTVARQSFNYVVVDAGSRVDLMGSALFEPSSAVYLVTQAGISELRNANRMITRFFGTRTGNLQIVLNRYKSGDLLFDDKQIVKALTRAPDWKIPDDFAAARRTRDTVTPVALTESALSDAIQQMARTAGGLPASRNGKKGILRFLR
jgi:pilus assembly protein CpaE